MAPTLMDQKYAGPIADSDIVDADLRAARHVLDLEARALDTLAEELDVSFHIAVQILSAATGRVIVTGMGKSGHIARKIAATFASTGTPSQFVHPAEASHGDMGMITSKDTVLALSNSGETRELGDLLEYTKRFSVPLIAITSGRDSTLATYATVALVMPAMPEAGRVGLAPTTSTTMSLALGDALAIALLERKGFDARDFGLLHPGGKLGQQLMRARDLMHGGDELPLVPDTIDMQSALLAMTGKRFGTVGVTGADGRLVGIVTDGDLRRHMSANLLGQSVRDVMTADPVVAQPDILAVELLAMMNERKISAIFVIEQDRPVGILHLHDLIRAGLT